MQRALASRIADEVLVHAVEIGVLSFRPDDPYMKKQVDRYVAAVKAK